MQDGSERHMHGEKLYKDLPMSFNPKRLNTRDSQNVNESLYFVFYPIAELPEINRSYGVQEHLPDHLAFGTDETSIYTFNSNGLIFRSPFGCPYDDELAFVAESFAEFLEKLPTLKG